jgi:hypothetical protein
MRDQAIVLLAAASSILFSAGSIARAKPDLHQRLENTAPASGMTLLYRPALLGLGRSMGSPRMITWSVCSTTTSGSALSIYSRSEESAPSLQGSAIREDVPSRQCADDDGDDEDKGPDENLIAGARFAGSTAAGASREPM